MTTSESDKAPKQLLYAKVGVTEGWERIIVWRNGKVAADTRGQWYEVDVLGCWGTRVCVDDHGQIMYDDDGMHRLEKVYGYFELKWREEPKPLADVYAEMAKALGVF